MAFGQTRPGPTDRRPRRFGFFSRSDLGAYLLHELDQFGKGTKEDNRRYLRGSHRSTRCTPRRSGNAMRRVGNSYDQPGQKCIGLRSEVRSHNLQGNGAHGQNEQVPQWAAVEQFRRQCLRRFQYTHRPGTVHRRRRRRRGKRPHNSGSERHAIRRRSRNQRKRRDQSNFWIFNEPGQTLQATALVHDAYLRLVDQTTPQQWDNRRHFFAAAAEAMRLPGSTQRPPNSHPPSINFAGLTTAQAAEALGVSVSTTDNDWTYARSWLRLAKADGGNSWFS